MSVGSQSERPRASTRADRAEARASMPRKQLLRFESSGPSGLEYFVSTPSIGAEMARVFVAVHGISRNVQEHASLFAPYCEAHGVMLVAPHFTEDKSKDYQRLGRLGRGPRSDAALDSILEEIHEATGAATERIYLFGFSGGAQFAHRYAMAYPHRVARAVIAAAGWYTFPDRRKRFPYGTRRSQDLPEVRFDPEAFLQVPMTVIVGDRDITDIDLRRTPRVNRQQGETRLERARNWVEAMRATARSYRLEPLVNLETIPGGDHGFAGLMQSCDLGGRVFASMFRDTPRPVERARHG